MTLDVSGRNGASSEGSPFRSAHIGEPFRAFDRTITVDIRAGVVAWVNTRRKPEFHVGESAVMENRVVFRAPMAVELEPFDLDKRELGPTEVIVRTRVTLISPGTELANLQGKLGMHSDDPGATR